MQQNITIKVAANISYNGTDFNTPLFIEYEHTGKLWFYKKGRAEYYTPDEDIAQKMMDKGKKVTEKAGYFFMKRLTIPTITATGKRDIWYINNEGDSYAINKISKYGKKLHQQLSNNIIPVGL